MSLHTEEGREVHFPAKADKFEFDAEVTRVFDKMARRSIPNYMLAHTMHAAVAARHVPEGGSVLDIGASHGQFLMSLFETYAADKRDTSNITFTATDLSLDMCEVMRSHFKGSVLVKQQDLMENEFLQDRTKYDFINCMYVLQFIPAFAQPLILTKLCTMLKPGGMLSIGQKESLPGSIGEVLHGEYIKFRLNNGYTQEEIDAKSAALKNSMWPMTKTEFLKHIDSTKLMNMPVTVTRNGVFATYVIQRKNQE